MSCDNVLKLISLLLDGRVAAREGENLLAHLESCRKCNAHFESLQQLREQLRGMGKPPMPAGLGEKLRVIASHERVRQLSRMTLAARTKYWSGQTRLLFDNLMRPLALPFAGGLLSALVLFSLLVPNLSFYHNYGDEPPTSVFTYPDGKVVGAIGEIPRIQVDSFTSEAPAVLLTVDETGRVTDYSIVRGELTPDMKSIIMFSRFTPATIFGHPTYGKVLVSLRPILAVRS